MKNLSIKVQLALFLILFAAYLSIVKQNSSPLLNCLIAGAFAVSFDSALTYIKSKKLIISDSSAVSGFIIGLVLSSVQPWWIFLLASIFAIGSKHLIRFNKRHLFNPAGFGIFLTIVLFGAAIQWKGAELWYVLIPFGLYFVYKIRKLEIVYSYLAVSLFVFGVQAVIQKLPLLDVIVYQNWFFIFVMLIEPKTTPVAKKGKMAFGGLAALTVFLLTITGVKFDPQLSALLILNPFVPVLNNLE